MATSTIRTQRSIATPSIAWLTTAPTTCMRTRFQMAPIGAIGMVICKATTVCLRLAIRFHAPSTTTARSIAGGETTMDNSVWATPAAERRRLSTLTLAPAAPSLPWASEILEPKDGRPILMPALFLTTASWCVGAPMGTGNLALETPQPAAFGNRPPWTLSQASPPSAWPLGTQRPALFSATTA